MEWKTIESAPQDGSMVLLLLKTPLDAFDVEPYIPNSPREIRVVVGWKTFSAFNGKEWECCFWEEGSADSYGVSSTFPIGVTPSHWMPLPQPTVSPA